MDKLDLKKQLRELYTARAERPVIVDPEPAGYLMIDGRGDPNTASAYVAAIQALYTLSYTLKFAVKKSRELDYTVLPLEGLWWIPDMRDFMTASKDSWLWTAMIRQPDFITVADVTAAKEEAKRKKKDNPALDGVELATFDEGLSAQVLHVGPYAAEGPTIAALHAWISDNGYGRAGKHHEVYLNNPERTAPEKMKTIIRQPVRKV